MNMKRLSVIVACLLLILLGYNFIVPHGIKYEKGNYNKERQLNLSQNDIISFIYRWFSAFEHQVDRRYILQSISKRVSMDLLGRKIEGKEEFIKWYEGVVSNIQDNSFTVKKVIAKGSDKEGWKVKVDYVWKATTYEGKEIEASVHQDWSLRVVKGRNKIKRILVRSLKAYKNDKEENIN